MTILLLVHVLQAVFSCALSHFHSHYLRAGASCNVHLHFTVCLPLICFTISTVFRISMPESLDSGCFSLVPIFRLRSVLCARIFVLSPPSIESAAEEKNEARKEPTSISEINSESTSAAVFFLIKKFILPILRSEILCNNFNQTEKKSAAK